MNNKVIIIIGSSVREHIICKKLTNQKCIIISDFVNPKIHQISFKYFVCNLTNHNILQKIHTIQSWWRF